MIANKRVEVRLHEQKGKKQYAYFTKIISTSIFLESTTNSMSTQTASASAGPSGSTLSLMDHWVAGVEFYILVPGPTTRQPYAVAQSPFRERGRPRGHRLPAPAQAPLRLSPRGRRPRPVTVPARAPRPPTRLHMCTRDICLGIAGIMIDVQHRVPAQSASSEIGQANDPGIVTPGRDRSARGRSGARGAGR